MTVFSSLTRPRVKESLYLTRTNSFPYPVFNSRRRERSSESHTPMTECYSFRLWARRWLSGLIKSAALASGTALTRRTTYASLSNSIPYPAFTRWKLTIWTTHPRRSFLIRHPARKGSRLNLEEMLALSSSKISVIKPTRRSSRLDSAPTR